MTSPFVVSYEGRACTEKRCDPFFIREWETMVVGALIVATLVYLGSCGYEYFASDRKPSGWANTQRDFSQRSDSGSDRSAFAAVPPLRTAVQRGAYTPSSGVSTEKFMDFARVDAVDDVEKTEPPTHQPETPDDSLVPY